MFQDYERVRRQWCRQRGLLYVIHSTYCKVNLDGVTKQQVIKALQGCQESFKNDPKGCACVLEALSKAIEQITVALIVNISDTFSR
jgi:hypothetical protein